VFYLINFGIVEFIVYYYISFLWLSKSSCVSCFVIRNFNFEVSNKNSISSCIMFRNYNFEVSIKNTIVFEKCIVLFFKTKRLHDTCYNSVPSKKNKNNIRTERSRKWKYKMSESCQCF
jgi:hypothetical protein